MSPRLSILTTCYNDGDTLARSLGSSLDQTESEVEVILVNNGSRDCTSRVAAEFAQHDPRVRLITVTENIGCPAALNLAVGMARAPWCLIVNADDYIERDYVAAILDEADRDPSLNCIYSSLQMFGHQHRTLLFAEFQSALATEHHMVPGPRAFRKELWEALGGEDEAIAIGADWDWVVRASVLGIFRPRYLPHAYYHFYVPPLGQPRLSQQGVDAFPALQAHMRSHTRESLTVAA